MAKGGKGHIETLNHWATETAGGEAHFAWGTSGDFDRCVAFHKEKAGLSDRVAKGHCANLHHRALGVWPGQEHKKGEASTMDTAHGYVPILKHEKLADGTLLVEGIATDSGIDRDQQICDPGWLAKAMPAWFQSGGNIREQHDPKRAAGVAIQYTPKAEGHHIRARIVDPISVAKVESKVLKGFSFGARGGRVVVDKAAKGGRIVDGDIYEVSLVDRPANPRCTLTIAKTDGAGDLQALEQPELVEKADDEPRFTPTQFAELLKGLGKTPTPVPVLEKRDVGEKERGKLADEGKALPGGGFPIKNAADLKNAIRAIGRAKDPAAAKALIRRRAKDLGREDLIPSSWGDTSKADGEQVHDPDDIASVRDGLIALIKAELDELADGENELADVSDLLVALRMLMSWWMGEARRGETTNPFDTTNQEAAPVANIELADGAKAAGTEKAPEADTTKTEQPAATGEQKPATDQPTEKTEGTENATEPAEGPVTISKSDVASMITDAITKAVQPYEERVKALEGELAEVKATPIPGGPARTRTPSQTAITQKADALRATVEHLQKAVDQSTGALQQGYRERLDEATTELRSLEGSTTS